MDKTRLETLAKLSDLDSSFRDRIENVNPIVLFILINESYEKTSGTLGFGCVLNFLFFRKFLLNFHMTGLTINHLVELTWNSPEILNGIIMNLGFPVPRSNDMPCTRSMLDTLTLLYYSCNNNYALFSTTLLKNFLLELIEFTDALARNI